MYLMHDKWIKKKKNLIIININQRMWLYQVVFDNLKIYEVNILDNKYIFLFEKCFCVYQMNMCKFKIDLT